MNKLKIEKIVIGCSIWLKLMAIIIQFLLLIFAVVYSYKTYNAITIGGFMLVGGIIMTIVILFLSINDEERMNRLIVMLREK